MFTRKFWADLLERAFWTFGETFFGVLIADSLVDRVSVSIWGELSAALIAGFIAAGKAIFIGRNVGNSESASTLPAGTEP